MAQKKIVVFILTCKDCGTTANGNSREADGWTIAPKVKCPSCNGTEEAPMHLIPAKERNKFIPVNLTWDTK